MHITEQENRRIGIAIMIGMFMITVAFPSRLTGINFLAWVILAVVLGLAARAWWHGVQAFVHWYMRKDRR